jgi:hypothetical protein
MHAGSWKYCSQTLQVITRIATFCLIKHKTNSPMGFLSLIKCALSKRWRFILSTSPEKTFVFLEQLLSCSRQQLGDTKGSLGSLARASLPAMQPLGVHNPHSRLSGLLTQHGVLLHGDHGINVYLPLSCTAEEGEPAFLGMIE